MSTTDQMPENEGNEPDTMPESTGTPGSIRLGPLTISAKMSIVLIFFIVVGFNLILFLGVVLAALYRAGRL